MCASQLEPVVQVVSRRGRGEVDRPIVSSPAGAQGQPCNTQSLTILLYTLLHNFMSCLTVIRAQKPLPSDDVLNALFERMVVSGRLQR